MNGYNYFEYIYFVKNNFEKLNDNKIKYNYNSPEIVLLNESSSVYRNSLPIDTMKQSINDNYVKDLLNKDLKIQNETIDIHNFTLFDEYSNFQNTIIDKFDHFYNTYILYLQEIDKLVFYSILKKYFKKNNVNEIYIEFSKYNINELRKEASKYEKFYNISYSINNRSYSIIIIVNKFLVNELSTYVLDNNLTIDRWMFINLSIINRNVMPNQIESKINHYISIRKSLKTFLNRWKNINRSLQRKSSIRKMSVNLIDLDKKYIECNETVENLKSTLKEVETKIINYSNGISQVKSGIEPLMSFNNKIRKEYLTQSDKLSAHTFVENQKKDNLNFLEQEYKNIFLESLDKENKYQSKLEQKKDYMCGLFTNQRVNTDLDHYKLSILSIVGNINEDNNELLKELLLYYKKCFESQKYSDRYSQIKYYIHYFINIIYYTRYCKEKAKLLNLHLTNKLTTCNKDLVETYDRYAKSVNEYDSQRKGSYIIKNITHKSVTPNNRNDKITKENNTKSDNTATERSAADEQSSETADYLEDYDDGI